MIIAIKLGLFESGNVQLTALACGHFGSASLPQLGSGLVLVHSLPLRLQTLFLSPLPLPWTPMDKARIPRMIINLMNGRNNE